jgi:hypothetical protein
MAPKITIKKEYILVEPETVEFWEIVESAGIVRNLPEFSEKNDIWLFRESPIQLVYEDLYKLKDIIQKIYPENVKRNKTAIVVGSGLQSALAESFRQIADGLPFEIQIFTDFQAAEDWIKK